MATVSSALSDLPLEQLALYQASDPYLSSIFVFYGPVATANATVSSSRIQAHILTPAGFQSYPRITISPAAPLYAAVNHLPREKQGDEICRGLAVSMLKYFAELSDPARECLETIARAGKPGGKIPKLFDEMHAADLANRMTKVDQTSDIVRDIRGAFQERKVPWVDIDLVFPTGTIQPPHRPENDCDDDALDAEDNPDLQYGQYSPLVRALGPPMFLPTSRLKRAPSQPTNLSKSRIFTRSQKESLRLTMCELVDTEERYVSKLYSLVREVAEEFRIRAQGRGPSSTSPDEAALTTLFPPCLNEILDVNLGFLEVIRHVLEETEREAIADIGDDTELPSSMAHRMSSREGRDAMGAVAFANALLEWFPRFSQPYADYMRAHTGFTQTLNSFMRDRNSSFSKRVYETGEQQLRSLLMEPVQRLPRYSLLIDTMTSSLPLIHPAVKPLLKARDVIKDICSLDDPSSTNHDQSFRRLKELVDGWPATILPTGRLITAVDFNELSPPYHLDNPPQGQGSGIMLIYKNCLVLLARTPGSRTTARGLLADLDSAASGPMTSPGLQTAPDIRVAQVYDLHTVRSMQSTCGRILFLAPTSAKTKPNQNTTVDLFALELNGMYEGRASRLIEEIVKAKIEGRFSESERENGRWTLRSPTGTVGNIGILACVLEEEQDTVLTRTSLSKIRVVFDTPRTICSKALSTSDVEAIVSVSSSSDDQYRVDMDSAVGVSSSDIVTADSFVPVLSKRLLNTLMPLHGPRNRTMTESIIHSNFEILRYLAGHLITQIKASRGFRPPSPTKLLSSLLGGSAGGGQSKDPSASSLKAPNSATLLGEFPKMPPPRANLPRSNTMPSAFPGKEETPVKISVVGTSPSKGPDSPFSLLEQTFAAYVLSLQSRSGNIVGRTLRTRDNVDRSSVNELYNVLLEDPGKIQAAAEVPVDTLFVAFETFMANAWKEHMGPVIDPGVLKQIQNQFDTMFPRDFEENFRKFLVDISPQNRRALASLVRLLAELLDASGNDGDRGALTAAFAEILTTEGDPMQHISLLDRLVDDFDNLFDEFIPSGASLDGILSSDQTKPSARDASSISSNASSFRKRFGFSLHRDGSKMEGESKVSSILRTLSKGKGSGESEFNTSRGSLLRSKSIDIDSSLGLLLRPGSRDRASAASSQEHLRRPDSSQGQPPSLSSLRGIPTNGVVKARRRRRSSLSDLRPGTASTETSAVSPNQNPRPSTPVSSGNPSGSELMTPTTQPRPQTSHGSGSTARSTSPAKSSSPTRFPSPSRRSPTRPATPSRKENIDPTLSRTDRPQREKGDASVSPTQDLKRRSRATSIPSSRSVGLKERPGLVKASDPKRPQALHSAQRSLKLRMQSPQKLRDRLQSEKRTQISAQLGLKEELALIGQELEALKVTAPQQTRLITQDPGSLDPPSFLAATDAVVLSHHLQDLESKFEVLSQELNGRTAAIERDLESSLVVSEKRAKKLDELYREASAENEALYDRFNLELGKIVRDVRSGSVEEALKAQLSEAMEEIGRLKKENFRLKREASGLRAQQAAVALLKASE
ncbi:putative Rho guanyl nucleotide exchange factor [Aspergillus clavatus NRRL 1]|uniref:Rho guanyl nucleotide exchange factor, putative n=1 Tax=Aspergillus clavatus (strain ATCC 1007 / CBS 513.65 / DSM 816 / NCTC 3887 / NRRL 1 / QM 1276 / 107) TaxID=344612 RepID=A1CBD7_ASPCL|nr:Rho guanyl nucleotide exchange factor, putative [Aspergillus clavatus NRRL 1]EAW13055.1 Rho guanyl nucleotide exchange factor, putative [Aspergillus clavatus NRRL 1]